MASGTMFALYPKELCSKSPFRYCRQDRIGLSHNVGYVPTAPIVHAHNRSRSLYKELDAHGTLPVSNFKSSNLASLVAALPTAKEA